MEIMKPLRGNLEMLISPVWLDKNVMLYGMLDLKPLYLQVRVLFQCHHLKLPSSMNTTNT